MKLLGTDGALAGAGVVLDVDRSHAGSFEGRDGVFEGLGVGNDGDTHRVRDGLRARG